MFAVLYLIVKIQYGKGIHKLTLILMKSLYLYIEYHLRVKLDILTLSDIIGKTAFVFMLYSHKSSEYILIICILFQFCQAVKGGYPAVSAQKLRNKCGKLRIAQSKPSSLSNAVCLILKTFGIKLVPIAENGILQQFGMYLRNAVYIGGSIHSHICHMNGIIADQAHIVPALSTDVSADSLGMEMFIYHNDDAVNFGQYLLDKTCTPLFQSLSHNSVIGVAEYSAGSIKCLLKGIFFFRHKSADKLWNSNNRVSIVELDNVVVCKAAHVTENSPVLPDKVSNGSGAEEILLTQSQLFALIGLVIWIKHTGDILRTAFKLACF